MGRLDQQKPKFYVATSKLNKKHQKIIRHRGSIKKAAVSPQATMKAIRRNGIYQRRRKGSSLSLSSRSSSSPSLGLEFLALLGIGWETWSWSKTWRYNMYIIYSFIEPTSERTVHAFHSFSNIIKYLVSEKGWKDSFPNFSYTDPWFQDPEAWRPVPPQQKPWARQSLQQKTKGFSSAEIGPHEVGLALDRLVAQLLSCSLTKTTKKQ